VASVHRVRLAELLDPANRFQVSHPSGYVGAAFDAAGLLVWGFTAGLLDRMLRLAGWELPWDRADVRDLPADQLPRDRTDVRDLPADHLPRINPDGEVGSR
jgi:hypothetical protein